MGHGMPGTGPISHHGRAIPLAPPSPMGITCWQARVGGRLLRYRVKKLVAHHIKYDGTKEYLVQWHGKNPKNGQLWADSWSVHPRRPDAPDLVLGVEVYEVRHKAGTSRP